MDDVLIAYWRELGAKVTAAWPTEPISGRSNVPERLERLARLAAHCAELGSQLSTHLVNKQLRSEGSRLVTKLGGWFYNLLDLFELDDVQRGRCVVTCFHGSVPGWLAAKFGTTLKSLRGAAPGQHEHSISAGVAMERHALFSGERVDCLLEQTPGEWHWTPGTITALLLPEWPGWARVQFDSGDALEVELPLESEGDAWWRADSSALQSQAKRQGPSPAESAEQHEALGELRDDQRDGLRMLASAVLGAEAGEEWRFIMKVGRAKGVKGTGEVYVVERMLESAGASGLADAFLPVLIELSPLSEDVALRRGTLMRCLTITTISDECARKNQRKSVSCMNRTMSGVSVMAQVREQNESGEYGALLGGNQGMMGAGWETPEEIAHSVSEGDGRLTEEQEAAIKAVDDAAAAKVAAKAAAKKAVAAAAAGAACPFVNRVHHDPLTCPWC